MNDLVKLLELYPDKPWDYDYLSRNPSITCEFVCANPDKPWNYDCLSRNPSISWEIVRDNPDIPWDWVRISENDFNYSIKKQQQDKAARIIQRNCNNWIDKPYTADGKVGISARIGLRAHGHEPRDG